MIPLQISGVAIIGSENRIVGQKVKFITVYHVNINKKVKHNDVYVLVDLTVLLLPVTIQFVNALLSRSLLCIPSGQLQSTYNEDTRTQVYTNTRTHARTFISASIIKTGGLSICDDGRGECCMCSYILEYFRLRVALIDIIKVCYYQMLQQVTYPTLFEWCR